MDGDAVIDVRARKVIFRQCRVTFNCVEPEEPPKPPRYVSKWPSRSKSNNVAKAKAKSNTVKIAKAETVDLTVVATAITKIEDVNTDVQWLSRILSEPSSQRIRRCSGRRAAQRITVSSRDQSSHPLPSQNTMGGAQVSPP
jgi:hypothetical protein